MSSDAERRGDGSRARRVAVVVVAAIVAATCVGLGIWQLRRLEERRTLNETIRERRSSDPLTISSLLDAPAIAPYRTAVLDGRYDPAGEVLVYGRSLGGQPGHLVVTPLRLLGDGTVLVVRGWVPFRVRSAPVTEAAPPLEDARVRGWFVPGEHAAPVPGEDRIVRALDVEAIAGALPYAVHPLPFQLSVQSPPQSGALPVPVPLPALSEGPHLSYAIQWFSFAAIAVVGAAVLLRRERRRATGGL